MGDGADDAREAEELAEFRDGPDQPHPNELDRFAIYAVTRRGRWRLAETSLDGIGLTLRTLHEEGQTTGDGVRVGILDRATREWLINPWKGTGLEHV